MNVIGQPIMDSYARLYVVAPFELRSFAVSHHSLRNCASKGLAQSAAIFKFGDAVLHPENAHLQASIEITLRNAKLKMSAYPGKADDALVTRDHAKPSCKLVGPPT